MTDQESDDCEKAKTLLAEVAYGLQHKLPAFECANMFAGCLTAILRKAGGDELLEAYLSELLDDARLQAQGYFTES